MSYYYFLETALQPLEFPDKPDTDFGFILHLYEENLSESDKKSVNLLRKYIDVLNIRSFYLGYPINNQGCLNQEELAKALEDSEYFSQQIFDVLNQHEENRDKIKHFPSVLKVFYDEHIEKGCEFLKWFFSFEKYSRIILCAFRCKNIKKDILEELSFEDPLDPVVSEVLSQKDSPHFESPSGFEELVELLHLSKGSPKRQYHDFSEYRFRMIKQHIDMSTFTLDWVLGYLALFMILDEYHNTNPEEGANTLNKMMKDI